MALAVKFLLDYDDEAENTSWSAEILQEGYGGGVLTPIMGGNPVQVLMRDIDDPFTPVCHTEATVTLVSETLGQYDEFKTADVFEYVLRLKRAGSIYWQGPLITEPFTEPFISAPYDVKLKFGDGLSELQYERFDVGGVLQSGFETVIDILVKCFDKLPISRGFREIINVFEDSMDDADTKGLFEQLIIFEPAFWERDFDDGIKGEDCLKIIEGIMYSLKCRLIVSEDKYYIIRIGETKTGGVVKHVDYDSTGTVTGNSTIDLRKPVTLSDDTLPDLLAHLNGASIDLYKQYQEVEFRYSSKNITSINNSILINGEFDGGFELENGSPVPLNYTRSTAVNTVLGVTPTALHLDESNASLAEFTAPGVFTFVPIETRLVMEDALLINTRIVNSPARIKPDIPPFTPVDFLAGIVNGVADQLTRETYFLQPESPADATITYKNLLTATGDHLEIRIEGWFDYTFADLTILNTTLPLIFHKWTIKLGANFYNTGTKTWSTNADARTWFRGFASQTDEWIDQTAGTKRHHFSETIVLENFPDDSVDDLTVTWFIPENYRAPDSGVDRISEVEVVFNAMELKYVSTDSTEFSIQKVLGETGSTDLRSRRYISEVRHGDGPSNFSVMSFRLPTTNLATASWSSRGGAESLPGYDILNITPIFENLGTYRLIFNGDLYGLLELHNVVSNIEGKQFLIKGMKFDTKINLYHVKLHEVGVFVPVVAFVPQFNLSGFSIPTVSDDEFIDPIETSNPSSEVNSQTNTFANTEEQTYTQTAHVQNNNDSSETADDYPIG